MESDEDTKRARRALIAAYRMIEAGRHADALAWIAAEVNVLCEDAGQAFRLPLDRDAEKASVADTDRRAATELRWRVSHLADHQMWLAEAASSFAQHRMFAIAVARGMASPWPPRDVVDKLAEGVSHLLADHDCDAHGHELFKAALDKAYAWLRGDPA